MKAMWKKIIQDTLRSVSVAQLQRAINTVKQNQNISKTVIKYGESANKTLGTLLICT